MPFQKGHIVSEETKKKISATLKGKFIGEDHPFFGKHQSEEARKLISESKKGRIPWIKGKKHSEETKKKWSEKRKGQTPWNKGKKGVQPVLSGENAPNWKGGTSFGPYCPKFNKRLKEKIRERDNRTCQLCGRTEKENLQRFKQKLCMHHIHYDKPNCNPDLISLCKECSTVVNYNRAYYENLFMEKLKARGLA